MTFPRGALHSGGGSGDDLAALERMVDECEAIGLPSRFVAAPDLQYRAMRMPFLGDARMYDDPDRRASHARSASAALPGTGTISDMFGTTTRPRGVASLLQAMRSRSACCR